MEEQILPYHVPVAIKQALSSAKETVIKHDQDRIYLITGREGSGKSKLARQFAYFFDKTFNLDRIVFNPEDFKKLVRTLPKYSAIVFDEAFRGLSSRGALSKANKELIRLLQECRQRNLFIFIVLPSIFLLEKYVGLFRTTTLFHVSFKESNPNKRWYKVYDYENKKLLYLLGQKLMSYSRPKIELKWSFSKNEVPSINEEEYQKKKYEAFKKEEEEEEDTIPMRVIQRTMFSWLLYHKFKMKWKEQEDYLKRYGINISSSVLARYSKECEKRFKLDE